jgi:hypothetical protein
VAGESEIARAVLQIANRSANGVATFKRCYAEIPALFPLAIVPAADAASRSAAVFGASVP